MFKYVFGVAILILLVIAFFPTVAKLGVAMRDYFMKVIGKEK